MEKTSKTVYRPGSFGYDLHFLQQYHKNLVALGDDSSGAQLIILPAYQGRVMTSSATGLEGKSFGWINHELIASGKTSPHMSAFGGEDRFWLGPEGGQFSIYFKKGAEFIFDNWFVPAQIDTEAFTLTAASTSEANFEKQIRLENYSGTIFDLVVNRTIRLLSTKDIEDVLDIAIPPGIRSVAFASENNLTNTGQKAWTRETGLLSIWILSMLNASHSATIALPYQPGSEAERGPIVTDDYFGKVPVERLKAGNGLILFKADAQYRSKIGLGPKRALPLAASYDAANQVLTIAQFTIPPAAGAYVNSLWEIQNDPFDGDVVNAYNDGPINGSQMGSFYEIESSSPAAALAPGQSIQHVHRTIHLSGTRDELSIVTKKIFGAEADRLSL